MLFGQDGFIHFLGLYFNVSLEGSAGLNVLECIDLIIDGLEMVVLLVGLH